MNNLKLDSVCESVGYVHSRLQTSRAMRGAGREGIRARSFVVSAMISYLVVIDCLAFTANPITWHISQNALKSSSDIITTIHCPCNYSIQ